MHELDEITGSIVDAAMRIHKELGPGLLESVYEALLTRALTRRGLQVERQKPIRFKYGGVVIEDGFRVDLLVDAQVIIEIKSLEKLAPVHGKLLLTYLRLMNLPVGLLINFGGATLKEGLHRIVNNLPSSASPREPGSELSAVVETIKLSPYTEPATPPETARSRTATSSGACVWRAWVAMSGSRNARSRRSITFAVTSRSRRLSKAL